MQLAFDIIYILGQFYITLVALRFILQVSRADFYNPISQFIVKATNPLLIPLRRLIPGYRGIDFASLVLAIALQYLLEMLIRSAHFNVVMQNLFPLLGIALMALLQSVIQLYTWALILVVIISWVAPGSYHPGALLLNQITEPLLRPIRQVIPATGGLDLSPMVLMLLLFIMGRVVSGVY
jgi:YggT family protein